MLNSCDSLSSFARALESLIYTVINKKKDEEIAMM